MSEVIVSKGIAALRLSNNKPEKVVVDGETFYFKRLTIDEESKVNGIILSFQDSGLLPPEALKDGATKEEMDAFRKEMFEYTTKSAQAFRKLTAELMKYVLVDEAGNKFFNESDDVYSMLNNIYADKFHIAFQKFRGNTETGGVAGAETRFQK